VGQLYFGDNLNVLSDHIDDESVDMIYLDPPFNSKAQYHVLFKTPDSVASSAQAEAFLDAWSWGEAAEYAFDRVIEEQGGGAARILTALRSSMGESDMMAYLAMMTVRLADMHRALKPTGFLFLHCDPTASHYLKVILDGIFEPRNFRNELIWKRQTTHSDAKSKFPMIHDTLLLYAKSPAAKFNVVRQPLSEEYVAKFYKFTDANGRRYQLDNMAAPEGGGMAAINRATGRPNGWYEWKGYEPPKRGWRYSKETMAKLDAEGRLHYPEDKTQRIRLKRYLDENEGQVVGSVWTDISPLHGAAREAMGYPTQKPLALLERAIDATTQEGDLILDPFCGCGTTVHAAEKKNRRWIGIDITHHAITVIEDRMSRWFPGIEIPVEGRPVDLAGARDLARRNKYQFQWWANWLFGVSSYRTKKGADGGIDGEIYFKNGPRGVGRIIISVKGEKKTGVLAVRELASVLEDEKAELGVLVTLSDPTPDMISRAVSAGFVTTAHGKFPRIQLAPISEIFANKKPALPVRAPIDQLKAPRAKKKKKHEGQLEFTFAFSGGVAARAPSPGEIAALNPVFASPIEPPPKKKKAVAERARVKRIRKP
jgi:adenine specific DNA methylase Mod